MIFKLYEEESEMKPYAATTLAISLVLSASAFAQTVGVTVTNGDSRTCMSQCPIKINQSRSFTTKD